MVRRDRRTAEQYHEQSRDEMKSDRQIFRREVIHLAKERERMFDPLAEG